jgi:hypothetical protein
MNSSVSSTYAPDLSLQKIYLSSASIRLLDSNSETRYSQKFLTMLHVDRIEGKTAHRRDASVAAARALA